jgi:hypothetical protein
VINDRYHIAMTDYRTVAFRTQYADHYRAAGATVPDGAKGSDWWCASVDFLRSTAGIIEITRQLGFYPAPIFG